MRKIYITFLTWTSFLYFLSVPVSGQERQLIEAAKKEGAAVVVYGSLESDSVDPIKNAFEKKTGLRVDYWRASSTKVMDRALSEYRAGKPLFDALFTNGDPMRIMAKEGIFSRYDSPIAKKFAKDMVDPELGPRFRNDVIGIVFNSSIIKPADAPKSLEDLVKPQYKGKLVMPDPTQHTTTTQWLANLHKLMGREKADRYVRDLGAMKPILLESLRPAGERVTTGETPVAITYIKYAFIFGQTGAPMEYVRLGKMLGDSQYIALSNKAPRPNAGKAFIDFFLDDESMKIMARMGEFVGRKGIYPPLPDADKVEFVPMDELGVKGYTEKKKEYTEIFLR